MGRYELSDDQWDLLAHFFPENKPVKGRPWVDHRRVFNGISWILHAGAPWRDLPSRYGPWQTVYDRFNRWRKDGTLDRALAYLQEHLDSAGAINWDLFCVDGSSIRAARAAAGAPKKTLRRTSRRTTRSVGRGVAGARRSTSS